MLKPFASYQEWAGDYFTVVPLRNGIPCGSPHASFWYKPVSEGRKDLWRADARDRGGNGAALLLDSPSIKHSLCFVDVDDSSKLETVRRFLRERLNVMYLAEVTTGRGVHIYFRREAGLADGYTTNNINYFGTFKKADGKEASCVDLRGHGSIGIMPGSTYDKREKGGILSAYRWGGRFSVSEPSVEEFLNFLPVMPLALWKEMLGKTSVEVPTEFAVIEDKDPHWLKVTPGLKVQDCPWCGHKTFKPSRKQGAYACFHDECRGSYPARIYVPASASGPKEHKDLEADHLISESISPDRLLSKDPVGWALDQAVEIMAEVPDRAQLGAVFPDDDPLKGWESEAQFAAAVAQKAALFDTPLGCNRGPTTFIAKGQTQTRVSSSCFQFSCTECGPKLKELLRVSIAASILTERISNIKGFPFILEIRSAAWASIPYDDKGFRALANRLNRWASSHEGAGWLGLRATPDRATVIAFGPSEALEVWPLHEGACGGLGVLEASIEVSNEIDLEAWRTWVDEERSRRQSVGDTAGVRVKILLAPAEFKGKVQALLDFLSGHNRAKHGISARALIGKGWASSPSRKEERESGDDYHTVTTFHTRKMHKFLEEKVQTTLSSKPVQKSSISRVERVELPCRVVPLQTAFVEAHPEIRAHRAKAKARSSSSQLSSLLED